MKDETFLFTELSDRDLLTEVIRLAGAERRATARLIASLAELDIRRLYLGEGYSSLFTYCTQALHLSESAAYARITAARTARRFPLVLTMLDDGSITLTTVSLLSAHLTPDNHAAVLWQRGTRTGVKSNGRWLASTLGRTCRPACASCRI